MTDRTYWHVPGARSWHADGPSKGAPLLVSVALCGRWSSPRGYLTLTKLETADRVPRDGHLCGSCARIIAARTDVEAA